MYPAHFSKTIIYIGSAIHPQTGKLVHVLIYGNKAINMNVDGANCMIIAINTRQRLGPENVLDTKDAPGLLDNMVEVISSESMAREVEMFALSLSAEATVFNTGIYTVVAGSAEAIRQRMHEVPQDRRPELDEGTLESFDRMYPPEDWQLTVWCFNNRDEAAATPVLIWYEPMDKETFHVPMLDSHKGGEPELDTIVQREHHLVVGDTKDYEEIGTEGNPVTWAESHDFRSYKRFAPEALRWTLPNRIVGVERRDWEPNGDYRIDVGVVNPGEEHDFRYVLPPGVAQAA